jgi:hypothetical protein
VANFFLHQSTIRYKFRLPDVGRVFAGNFGNGDGTFFCKNGKDMAG